MSKPVIAYIRVSTQSRVNPVSALRARRKPSVALAAEGYDIVQIFTEIETAKGADALELDLNSRQR